MARHRKDKDGKYLYCRWPVGPDWDGKCGKAVLVGSKHEDLCPDHEARLPIWPTDTPDTTDKPADKAAQQDAVAEVEKLAEVMHPLDAALAVAVMRVLAARGGAAG